MSKIAHIVALDASVLSLVGGAGAGLKPIAAADEGQHPLLDLSNDALWVGSRPRLEVDPSFVQPIPYIVVTDGERVLTYVRGKSGGEGRLHNKVSIGFGGHVDVGDAQVDPQTGVILLRDTLRTAAWRELYEELAVPDWIITRNLDLTWTHTIHSDATEVDRVHVGFVCEAKLTDTNWRPDPEQAEDSARELKWLTFAELAELTDPANPERAEPETWTRLLIEARTL